MKIDLTNYESWFLDYYEGTLSAEKVAELFLFLEQHINLKNEFERFELITLDEVNSVEIFENKIDLKKNNVPSFTTIDEWLIMELEGDLNLQQRIALLNFLSVHPQYSVARNLYQQTKMKADLSIQFDNKSVLLKRVIGQVPSARIWYAVAASILLLIGAWFAFSVFFNDHNTQNANNSVPIPTIIEPSIKRNSNLANSADKKDLQPISSEKKSQLIPSNKNSSTEKKKNIIPVENNLANASLKDNSEKHNSSSKNSSQENSIAINNHAIKNNVVRINQQEEIAVMTPKFIISFSEEEPFVFAQRKYIKNLGREVTNSNEELTAENIQERVVNTIKDFAANSANKVVGQELFATTELPSKLSVKSRLIRFTGAVIGKITNNRVKVKTAFDPLNGNLAAYELEMGKKVWQKQF